MIIYACLWKKISYRFSFPVVLYLGTSPLCRRKWRNKWWCLFPTSFWNIVKRVWRYQRSNQNPYIEEKQTTQWPKEKVRKNKQRSRNHTYKTKDRVTWTTLKTGGELRCSYLQHKMISSVIHSSIKIYKFPNCMQVWR